MFGRLLRNDKFVKVIIEGKLERNKMRGRPRRAFGEQMTEKIKAIETSRRWLRIVRNGRGYTDRSMALK